MAKHWLLLSAVCVLAVACGDTRKPSKPAKQVPVRAVEVVTDQSGSGKSSDAKGSYGSDQVEGEIGTDEEVSTKSYGETDPEKDEAMTPAPSEKPEVVVKDPPPPKVVEREAMQLTTVKKRKKNVKAFVKVGSETARELLWPDNENATSANDGICIKGAVTEIAFKIYSAEKGDLLPGGEEVGVLETGADTLVFGYEEDGCDDNLCQNDNIVRIRCPGGLKLIPTK